MNTEKDITMKDIPGYEGLYAATSCGKIWDYKNKKFLPQWSNGTPYLLVSLRKDGVKKNRRVHRLVALTYIDNPNPKTLKKVDHMNGNTHDNYVGNLQWADDTIQYCNRKNNIPIHDIITGEDYCSMNRAVKATGVSPYKIKKDCEHYLKTGEARRFVNRKYLSWDEYNAFMWEYFTKHRKQDKQGA